MGMSPEPMAMESQHGVATHEAQKPKPTVSLVASSPNLTTRKDEILASLQKVSNTYQRPYFYYKSLQWSADGTTLITSSSLSELTALILPPNLLTPSPTPNPLQAQSTLRLPEPPRTFAPSPYYTLSIPSTHLTLTSGNNLPIQLHTLFPSPNTTSLIAAYPLINHQTEAYLPASSLIWPLPSTFIAGSTNTLALFDITIPSSDPVTRVPTRKLTKSGPRGAKGVVSALSVQPSSNPQSTDLGLVATGTRTRKLLLYDLTRSTTPTSSFSVAPHADTIASIGGAGLMQTLWSPCGRYLLACERSSNGILVYDVRVDGKLLGWLSGRQAYGSSQALTCDVFAGGSDDAGFEVWASGVDGKVRVWEDVGNFEGEGSVSWDWQAHDEDTTVSSSVLHPTGSVVATCSGCWGAGQTAPRSLDSSQDSGDSEDSGTSKTSGSSSGSEAESEDESEDESDGGRPVVQSREDCCVKVWSISMSSADQGADEDMEQGWDSPRERYVEDSRGIPSHPKNCPPEQQGSSPTEGSEISAPLSDAAMGNAQGSHECHSQLQDHTEEAQQPPSSHLPEETNPG